jgi:hypothetical protein
MLQRANGRKDVSEPPKTAPGGDRLAQRLSPGALAIDDLARLCGGARRVHLWAATVEKLAVDLPSYSAFRGEQQKQAKG